MNTNCKTPVLLIAFNRPDNLSEVFNRVRQAQPPVLYLAIDGPRPDRIGEEDKCKECQEIINCVDWPCDIRTLFRDKNLGCGYGPSGAISWAFETTDRLIILEDDCVADLSFFQFCDEMLERYKDDSRVWLVSGRSHHPNFGFFENHDYVFSHYAHTWGWATWKRCWEHYDIKMADFPEWKELGGALNTLTTQKQGDYYNKWFCSIHNRIEDVVSHSWDAQWVYTYMKEGGLGIVPSKNLIHNIGCVGTHSVSHNRYLDLKAESLSFPLRHPKFVLPINDYESLHFKKHILKMNKRNIVHWAWRKMEGLLQGLTKSK